MARGYTIENQQSTINNPTQIRILLVDDDEDDYILTRDLLAGPGESPFEFEWAATYEAGLAAMEKHRHDVYLLDYRLGERNGLELLRRAVDLEIRAPMILLTSQGDTRVDMAAMEMGASDYLNKTTLTADLLQRSIRYALGRARSEETLRKSEEKFRSLSENAPDIIYTLGVDGSFTYVNPAWREIMGYGNDETLGKYFVDFVKEKDAGACIDLFKRVRNGKNIIRDQIISMLNKDGTSRLFNLSGAPNLNPSGEVTGMVGLLKDITEHRNAEARLQQAQKMEAIGTLAGGIAHDFNNILSAVIGYAELGKMSVAEGSDLYADLNQIYKAGTRAKELVKQILTFARQSDAVVRPIRVKYILKEVLKMLKASTPSSIEIRGAFESDAAILADPTQVHQVIMNLCTNATHAMADDVGVITVRLKEVPWDDRFAKRHPTLLPGNYLQLRVEDTGCGISPDILAKIFDPYFTTKGKGEGTGLGLSVIKGIVDGCKGVITVKSEPGKGSIFDVYFPIMESKSVKSAPKSEKRVAPTGDESVLVIDDEPAIAGLIQQLLTALGYRVTAHTSPMAALELFKSDLGRFDLVITDMTMPDMTGDLLTIEMKKLRPHIPVILCTGYSRRISEATAGAIGINALLMKPVEKLKLAGTVRSVLDEAR